MSGGERETERESTREDGRKEGKGEVIKGLEIKELI